MAMIKNFEPRLYQETILNTAAEKNTLVVLPTGMGKTNIFLMLAVQLIAQDSACNIQNGRNYSVAILHPYEIPY